MPTQQELIDNLYLTHQQTLVHILRRMVGCTHIAEDLAQEAYIKVSGAAKSQSIHYPQPFLYQTAKNLALDYLRREKTRSKSLDDQVEVKVQNEIVDSAPLPEQSVQAHQEFQLLLQALQNQPERRREMLILNKIHGWKHAEIAERFGVSKSAVEKNIRLALAHCLAAKLSSHKGSTE